MLDSADQALDQVRRTAQVIRDRAADDARVADLKTDLEVLKDQWHEERIVPLLSRGIFSDEYRTALDLYLSHLPSVAALMDEWTAAAQRLEAFGEAHAAFEEELCHLVGIVIEEELSRRDSLNLSA